MGMGEERSNASFTSAMTLEQSGVSSIPQSYVLPPSQRPNHNLNNISATLPIIDLSSLQDQSQRSQTVNSIRTACKEIGFFQVINHGIHESVMKDALDAAMGFFDLLLERFHQALLSSYLGLDPVMAFTSSKLQEEIKEGSQVLVVNCYPACPEPELTLGLPPHSDYGSITILLESHRGLQIQDHNNNWIPVQVSEKALMVQLGDQVEVMSNGQYKSVIHRVTVNPEEKRFSIASIHSLALEIKVGPASELVDEEHPKSYNQFSFRDFLDFITSNDITGGRFIDTD